MQKCPVEKMISNCKHETSTNDNFFLNQPFGYSLYVLKKQERTLLKKLVSNFNPKSSKS